MLPYRHGVPPISPSGQIYCMSIQHFPILNLYAYLTSTRTLFLIILEFAENKEAQAVLCLGHGSYRGRDHWLRYDLLN